MGDINLKPPLTIEQQIDLLSSRGLIISDTKFAQKILRQVNYYRLSAYSLGLRDNDVFHKGVTFEQIFQLYEFDSKFKHILVYSIEAIEISCRTQLAYYLANNHGSLSYLDSRLFNNTSWHSSLMAEFEAEKERQRNAAFVKHHNEIYGGKMPVWVALELFSFGMLSRLYSNLNPKIQRDFVNSQLGKSKDYTRCLPSWLKSLVEVRNICAHYGRLYNRVLSSTPRILPAHQRLFEPTRRTFVILPVIIVLLDNYKKSTTFILNINNLVEEYDAVNLEFIGFPADWIDTLYQIR